MAFAIALVNIRLKDNHGPYTIPSFLYSCAVAQVLAYVYQLRSYEFNGGVSPKFDADVPIPDELKRDK